MRLNKEREERLEPIRIESTKKKLEELGYVVTHIEGDKKLTFIYNNSKVTFFPYSGWFSGKTVKDGRGFKKLLKEI